MNVIFLQGGLGNQMFQYAFYLARKRKGDKVDYDCGLLSVNKQHNGFELDKLFSVRYRTCKFRVLLLRIVLLVRRKSKILSQIMFSCFNFRLIEDAMPSVFEPSLLVTQQAFYYGYWQTEKYFMDIEKDVKHIFTFPLSLLSERTVECRNLICTSNSISVHIRRGDYLKSNNIGLYGGICTLEYYEKSIGYMNERISDPVFIVFSDDMEWVKRNLQISDAVYVNWNQGADSWQDMYLMSQCRHNIIANSSFSWWGAWLNRNCNKIVVSPGQFLNVGDSKDIISNGWIKL